MERYGNSALHYPLSRRSDNADGLPRRLVASEFDEDGSETKTEAFSIQPFLSRRSQAKAEAFASMLRPGGSLFFGLQTLAFSIQPLAFVSVAEIIGKFGGADQLPSLISQ